MKVGDRAAFVTSVEAKSLRRGDELAQTIAGGRVTGIESPKGAWLTVIVQSAEGNEVRLRFTKRQQVRVRRVGVIESVMEARGDDETMVGVEWARTDGPAALGCMEIRWIGLVLASKVELLDEVAQCVCWELGATGPNQRHTRCRAHDA